MLTGRMGAPRATLRDLEEAAEVVYRPMPPTPQVPWPLLAERAGPRVWVKHENHTPIGSFKVRGALVYVDRLARRDPGARGLVAATRGNFGQAMAFAAARRGLPSVAVVPRGNSVEKNAAMRALGAELVEHGAGFQEAYEYAAGLAARRGLHFMRSFDRDLWLGTASYGLELLRAVPDLRTVYVPIGMGSGICGVIAARDALGHAARVVGVVAEGAPAYALSFAGGAAVATPAADTMADGLACRVPDPEAVEIIRAGADRVVTVTDAEIQAAMRRYFTDTHNVAEGAGAAPLAALLRERPPSAGGPVALVLSGGNVDLPVYRAAIDSSTSPHGETP